jgi:hypothetical protein
MRFARSRVNHFNESTAEYLDAAASNFHDFDFDIGACEESGRALTLGSGFERKESAATIGPKLDPVWRAFDNTDAENTLPEQRKAVGVCSIDDDCS